jgi:hypothetical protein
MSSFIARVQLTCWIAVVALLCGPLTACAQSADELAKQTQNPVASLIWRVDGPPDRADVDRGFFQPFANYNLGEGLAVGASIEATANWDDDEVWSSALLFTISKVTVLGKRPVNFVAGAGPMIASPDGGADWRLRVQANFLFPR